MIDGEDGSNTISNVRYSDLINGSRCGFFGNLRGLRRGSTISHVHLGYGCANQDDGYCDYLEGFTAAVRGSSIVKVSHLLLQRTRRYFVMLIDLNWNI